MKTLHKALYNRILTRTLVYMIVVVLVLAVSIPGLASGGDQWGVPNLRSRGRAWL